MNSGRLRFIYLCGVAATAGFAHPSVSAAQSLADLKNMSIDELANVTVSSVSKSPQPLADAPAAIYVIDHDSIVRSGAVTIPEMLRLAPNLQVYQTTPAHWVVTARGLNGNPGAQSFSNKLLVLVDGRSVYTPLFSGVYWDMPDVLPQDVERIEVISGPGATLWGANAVNGVINIISRSAADSQGAFVDAEGGSVQRTIGARIGGSVGPSLAYRVYARFIQQDSAYLPAGGRADDPWRRIGGGFRLDWTASKRDRVTLQGDVFDGNEEQAGLGSEHISGRDLVLRWTRGFSPDSQLQVQGYYDRIARSTNPGGGSFFVDTYDVDVQHSVAVGARNKVVWGGGARDARYRINGTSSLYFIPDSGDLLLANAFVQDTLAVSPAFNVTAGLKLEHDPYVGVSLLPDVRVAVKPAANVLLWGAVSRAVRSPTPFDEDVREDAGFVTLRGNPDFRTEKLTAYQLGLRTELFSHVTFSVTGFYHDYDDLRSIEIGPGPGFNLYWGNALAGNSYGASAWVTASPLPWWTLSAGTSLLREDFHFKPGATGAVVGLTQNGVDPGHQFTVRSSMNLGRAVMLDLDFRAMGALHGGDVPAYAELGGRLAWNVSDHVALTLSGDNLLHERHVEYPGGDAISRKVLVGVQWRP